MGIVKKIGAFILLDVRTMRLFIEAFFYLGWARYLVYLPFARVAPSLGSHMEQTPDRPIPANRVALKQVCDAVQLMSKYTPWESKCLVRAIAAMKMLEKRHVSCTLYLGTVKDEDGKMIAHAWLRSGPYTITGAEGMERFTVVATFAKRTSGEL